MKRCPTCNRTFIDQNLSFCVDDGTPLLTADTGDEATLIMSPADRGDEGASQPAEASPRPGGAPAYQPPAYVPPGAHAQPRRKAWPWILGLLVLVFLVVAGLGIAAAVLFPAMLRAASNSNSSNLNANIERRISNVNSNSSNSNLAGVNENENANSTGEDTSAPPTDSEAVLTDLKTLEDEWTVANINADKKTLNRILADDYVGVSEGKAQGKAEYLKTIERDTTIQHWEFEDLKVSLNGDRASLTGIIRLDVKDQNGQNQEVAYRFTDKFVWRDGRWQATSSEVNPVKDASGPVS